MIKTKIFIPLLLCCTSIVAMEKTKELETKKLALVRISSKSERIKLDQNAKELKTPESLADYMKHENAIDVILPHLVVKKFSEQQQALHIECEARHQYSFTLRKRKQGLEEELRKIKEQLGLRVINPEIYQQVKKEFFNEIKCILSCGLFKPTK